MEGNCVSEVSTGSVYGCKSRNTRHSCSSLCMIDHEEIGCCWQGSGLSLWAGGA